MLTLLSTLWSGQTYINLVNEIDREIYILETKACITYFKNPTVLAPYCILNISPAVKQIYYRYPWSITFSQFQFNVGRI